MENTSEKQKEGDLNIEFEDMGLTSELERAMMKEYKDNMTQFD